jgi:hypothetical protein
MRGLFSFPLPYLLPSYRLTNVREIEGAERDIDNAVCAEYDDEPNETPHNRALPLFTLRFIARVRDELKHAPEKHDERDRRKKQDYRIDNLHDDFPEERVEYGHLSAYA